MKTSASDFSNLEFNLILERLSEYALSPIGRERLGNLEIILDSGLLRDEIEGLIQMRDVLEFDDPFPLENFDDLYPTLGQCEVVGFAIRPEWAFKLGQFLRMSRVIFVYLRDRKEKCPLLFSRVSGLRPLESLERRISDIVDGSGEVKDSASPDLARIRRDISRRSGEIRTRLQSIMQDMVKKGYTQEDQLTIREGQLVIPMKQQYAGKLKGLVLDQSASGATVFIEPLAVVEIDNALRKLVIREKQEIEFILRELTREIRDELETIRQNLDIMVRIDMIHAKARYALDIDGQAVNLSSDGEFYLSGARHPLLLSRMEKTDVVPLDLKMGPHQRSIIVTGPNAGGKTVTLKTLGLLSVMFQHGLLIPADPVSKLPLFSSIFADIGDKQSIEQDLSTFSSHIANIRRIVDRADKDSLILLDEIGSATDPDEGAALAMSILKKLTDLGARTVATTHMGALKVFAHEEDGFENGSMIFDQETLSPTYRFQLGLPGSSYAFEIAERHGLDPGLIRQARDWVGEERGKLDKLIVHMEKELEKTKSRLYEAELRETELSGLTRLYQDELARLKTESDLRKQQLLEEAETVLDEANVTAERIVRELRESRARPSVIKASKSTIAGQKKRIQKLKKTETIRKTEAVSRGDWVKWKDFSGRAEVLQDPDAKGRVQILLNGMKLQVPIFELKRLEGAPPKTSPTKVSARFSTPEQVSDEIDLRGKTSEEAVLLVDHYLGDLAVSGLTQARIIHGKGTGALRREIGRFLKSHPMIKSSRDGDWDEGGTGVTIVKLK